MLTEDHINNVCKIGQGIDCCRYLTLGGSPRGFNCEKGTGVGILLDDRVRNGQMIARGDNCPGVYKAPAYRLKEDRFDAKAGDTVYKARSYDYGLASDDTRMTGVRHVSVTLQPNGGYPTFTCPEHLLEPIEESVSSDHTKATA
jgi:hypothetical protein